MVTPAVLVLVDHSIPLPGGSNGNAWSKRDLLRSPRKECSLHHTYMYKLQQCLSELRNSSFFFGQRGSFKTVLVLHDVKYQLCPIISLKLQ